jgi:clan AA aspartic protease
MISGVVNEDLEATTQLKVQGAGNASRETEAVIDTGFSGFLTLPPGVIGALGLPWLCRQEGILADGSIHVFDVYVGTIVWDGRPWQVEIEAADAQPLMGMALMQGYELRVQVITGGDVAIAAIP